MGILARLAAAAALLLAGPLQASTAFRAQAIAEQALNPAARGKLIWARAAESRSVDPAQWTFLFYDPFAEQNGRYVIVSNGAVTKVRQGYVELTSARLAAYKEAEILPPDKLRLDSDRAVEAVQNAARIRNIPLTAVHYELLLGQDLAVPVWKLTLYALRGKDPVVFCSARVSALTGEVFDLKVNRDRLR